MIAVVAGIVIVRVQQHTERDEQSRVAELLDRLSVGAGVLDAW